MYDHLTSRDNLLLAYRRSDLPLECLEASVRGWVNHARHDNTVGLRQAS
jgi:hypothetical protein